MPRSACAITQISHPGLIFPDFNDFRENRIRLILEAIPNKADKRLVCVSLFKVGTNDSVLAILSYYSH